MKNVHYSLYLLVLVTILGCSNHHSMEIPVRGYCQFFKAEMIANHEIIPSMDTLTIHERNRLIDYLKKNNFRFALDADGNIWLDEELCYESNFLNWSWMLVEELFFRMNRTTTY